MMPSSNRSWASSERVTSLNGACSLQDMSPTTRATRAVRCFVCAAEGIEHEKGGLLMPARGPMLCPGPWPSTARVGTAGSAPTALQTAAEAGTSEKCPKCYNSKSSKIGQKRINVLYPVTACFLVV